MVVASEMLVLDNYLYFLRINIRQLHGTFLSKFGCQRWHLPWKIRGVVNFPSSACDFLLFALLLSASNNKTLSSLF